MRHVGAAVIVALSLTPAKGAAPPSAAPAPNVTVGPVFLRQYVYPRFYLRPYGAYPGDGVPLVLPVPSVWSIGPVAPQAPGTVVTGQPTGLPQMIAPFTTPAGMTGGLGAPPEAANEIDQAIQMLTSPREHDRIEAAVALGRNKVDKAVEPLEKLLTSDPNPRVREAAARGLGLIGSAGSLKALENAAQADEDRDVRVSARFAADAIRGTRR
jgi:hypothetical protein